MITFYISCTYTSPPLPVGGDAGIDLDGERQREGAPYERVEICEAPENTPAQTQTCGRRASLRSLRPHTRYLLEGQAPEEQTRQPLLNAPPPGRAASRWWSARRR